MLCSSLRKKKGLMFMCFYDKVLHVYFCNSCLRLLSYRIWRSVVWQIFFKPLSTSPFVFVLLDDFYCIYYIYCQTASVV
jgi:hypothetical protein